MTELQRMAARVAGHLVERGHTVSVTESSAGGLVSAALLAVPGASRYFLGGGVIYTHQARAALLGLAEKLPAGMRASTEDYARLCASTVRAKLGTTWGLAETGAAGPSGNRYGDAAGHSCIAVVGPMESSATIETRSADREANMWAFSRAALELLERCLREAP
jgi:nicotinamide-nucleotide amidase